MDRLPRIAIAGNPNSGKTSIFNCLTGLSQTVGNYAGVTVELKEGRAEHGGSAFRVVDLPGTYSLAAFSRDELVARDYVVEERPDAVLNVVDATNLERNLYITVQLMEMRAPLVIALNMADLAEEQGIRIDAVRLGRLLGARVVPTVGSRGRGLDEALAACAELLADMEAPALRFSGRGHSGGKERAAVLPADRISGPLPGSAMEDEAENHALRPSASGHDSVPPPRETKSRETHERPALVTYGHMVEGEVARLALLVGAEERLAERYAPRWVAAKLIEGDAAVAGHVRELAPDAAGVLEVAAADSGRRIAAHFGADAATIIAERRYGFAAGAIRECVRFPAAAGRSLTERIDAVACSRWAGPVILAAVVYAMFFAVFKIGEEWGWLFGRSPKGWADALFAWMASAAAPLASRWPLFGSLLVDGVIGGVGGVVSFVPLIFLLFLFVAVLEDSGYIARVAFMTDRPFRFFGLQGKSALAMIVSGGLGGGGCAVPGVLAARTLREEKDRLVTMLTVPFMNCGAKLPVFLMLVGAFFPGARARMLLLLWALSWLFALGAAWMLRRFVVRGEQTPFVMELPPYHRPTLRGALAHAWERTWTFLKKAGTILLAVNVLLWALMSFPRSAPEAPAASSGVDASSGATPGGARRSAELAASFAGRLGRLLEPISRLAGFGWRENISLIGGLAAKEVIVGTMGTAYSLGEADHENVESLSARLARDRGWNPLRALAMMIFVLVYSPCVATLAALKRETGSWRWPAFATLYTTALAFVLAVAVFQLGRLAGWGLS